MSVSTNKGSNTRFSDKDKSRSYEAEWADSITTQDAACYINEIALELKSLARSRGLSFLGYLLDLVIEESAVQKRGRL